MLCEDERCPTYTEVPDLRHMRMDAHVQELDRCTPVGSCYHGHKRILLYGVIIPYSCHREVSFVNGPPRSACTVKAPRRSRTIIFSVFTLHAI